MREEHIKTEAIMGLAAMRRELTKYEDELPTITVMHIICTAMRNFASEANKGEYGAYAVKSLLRIWNDMKLGDVTGEKISELNAVVDHMYALATAESRRSDN